MQFLYCWKQDDNVRQPCRKGTHNVFGPSKNLLYLYTLMNPRGSGLLQLVGGAPPVPEAQEGVVEQEMPRVNVARLRR